MALRLLPLPSYTNSSKSKTIGPKAKMLTHKKWNVQLRVPFSVEFESLRSFLKFWVRCILKPKFLILAYKALGIWHSTYLSTLNSHRVLQSFSPLATFWGSSVQSRVPNCALPLPQVLMEVAPSHLSHLCSDVASSGGPFWSITGVCILALLLSVDLTRLTFTSLGFSFSLHL